MALPGNISYGTVVGRFMRAVIDGPDSDRDPDGIPMRDVVIRFTPSNTVFKNVTAASGPVTILADPIAVTTDENGRLIGPDGVEGIRLIATDDEDLSPSGWTWRVSIQGPGLSQSFSFSLPADSTVDLTTVIPVPPNPGDAVQRWEDMVQNAVDVSKRTLVDANVDGNGDLTFTRDNGQIVTAGNVTVPKGVITSPQVARIIALVEGDPLPPLVNGDIVIRYTQPGNIYYKDFSGDTVNTAPLGMTKLYGTDLTVQTQPGATGDKALQFGTSNSATAYAITDSISDAFLESGVEVLYRWRRGTGSHGASIILNIDAGTDSHYRVGYVTTSGEGRMRITVRESGSNVKAPEAPVTTLPASTFCMMRVRYADGIISGKTWVDGDVEPDWQITLTDTSLASGPGGIGTGGSVSYEGDWFVVATGGKKAVKP